MKLFVGFLALALSAAASAHPNHETQAPPPGFDTLKGLVGTWEGTATLDGKEVPVKTVFTTTSGGTVVEEKMNPGGDHEMTNMYHKDGSKLAMTHYCAMGNQPHMILKKGDAKSLEFAMEKPIGVASMSEPHMHAVKFTMADGDTLVEEWTSMGKGAKRAPAVFKFKRKK